MKKILSVFIISVFTLVCFSVGADAAGITNHDISSGNLEILSEAEDYNITGITTENNIVVDGGTHTLTLNNLTIDCSKAEKAGIELKNGANVTLVLTGDNTIKGGKSGGSFAGIQVPEGCTLTIKGEGTLDVGGGFTGAAIGSCSGINAGTINIESGTINATAICNGAGIGGGNYGKGGTVNISGGYVTATGSYSAGIGGGTNSCCC